MTYEQEFLKDFSEWLNQQVNLMAKAQQLAETEHEHDAAIRYESRLDAYNFLQTKFENYKNGKNFHDMPDLGTRTF
ncbi:DUF1912 family protein [Lactococcus nasutitermitis]|uniref:DUF1912 family protein n=1 Tax=Lactococcus nasutitermitis TaxID=1652957 RepID=A0ABV9JFA6_9LACT|nr:DUF1912 family protein [Lactococcus nasutitermitis]